MTSIHRATFFDLDGTLVDTEPLHFEAVRETLATVGLEIDETDYYRRYLSLTDRATFALAADVFARPDLKARVEDLVAEKERRFALRFRRGAPTIAGAAALVAAAAARGPIALVTGARRHEALAIVARDEFRDRFTTVVTADDIERSKPDPEGYLAAFTTVRARVVPDLEPHECLAFEDAPLGARAAWAAGMRVVAFATSRPREAFADADLVFPAAAAVDWAAIDALFAR